MGSSRNAPNDILDVGDADADFFALRCTGASDGVNVLADTHGDTGAATIEDEVDSRGIDF